MAGEQHMAPEQGAIPNAARGGCALMRHPPHGVFSACSPYQKQAPGGRAVPLQRRPPPGAVGCPGADRPPSVGAANDADQPVDLYELCCTFCCALHSRAPPVFRVGRATATYIRVVRAGSLIVRD